MIKNRVKETAAERGIENAADLARATRLSYDTAARIYRDGVVRIDFGTLDAVCAGLGCQVGELLVFVPDGKK